MNNGLFLHHLLRYYISLWWVEMSGKRRVVTRGDRAPPLSTNVKFIVKDSYGETGII
jgi:hypothetical protein